MINELKGQEQTGKVIALFGEVLADIFPDQTILGGAPFNVTRHLGAFSVHPVLVTRVGHDELRDELMQEMNRLELDTSGVQTDSLYPTGQVKVILESGNHRYEILPDQAYDHIHSGLTHMVTLALKPELIYFGTLAQRGMESRLALDKFLSAGQSPRFLDINLRKPCYNKHNIKRSLQRTDILKMNEEELDVIAQYFKLKGENRPQIARILANEFEIKKVVVTCGAKGCWMLNDDRQLLYSEPVEISEPLVDTVGAGDAFAAIFILGLISKWDMSLTISRANQLASAVCTIRGAAPHSLEFYNRFRREWGL
ncbi:MAG: carbohydrate kinase [Pseudomonadota bacterium]